MAYTIKSQKVSDMTIKDMIENIKEALKFDDMEYLKVTVGILIERLEKEKL